MPVSGSTATVRPTTTRLRPAARSRSTLRADKSACCSTAKGSEVKFGDEPKWAFVTEDGHLDRVIEADTKILVRNECCEETGASATLGQSEISFSLQPLPATLIAKCEMPGDVTVRINGRAAKLGEKVSEPFDKNTTQMSKTFEVSFAGENVSSAPKIVTVRANATETVTCERR